MPATVERLAEGLKVTLDAPTYAVTPGQHVVFYAQARCLGGAVIVATGAPPDAGVGRDPGPSDPVVRAAGVPAV